MHLSFSIDNSNMEDFITYWSAKYRDEYEEKYDRNIDKPLTEQSRIELFQWKNGSKISSRKLKSIRENYPLIFDGNGEERYLSHLKSGGAIWNIFYLHYLDHLKWPIYDQHTHRSMSFIKTGTINEIGTTNKKKYVSYKEEYIPFFCTINQGNYRKTDKALFAFGKILKLAKAYI